MNLTSQSQSAHLSVPSAAQQLARGSRARAQASQSGRGFIFSVAAPATARSSRLLRRKGRPARPKRRGAARSPSVCRSDARSELRAWPSEMRGARAGRSGRGKVAADGGKVAAGRSRRTAGRPSAAHEGRERGRAGRAGGGIVAPRRHPASTAPGPLRPRAAAATAPWGSRPPVCTIIRFVIRL